MTTPNTATSVADLFEPVVLDRIGEADIAALNDGRLLAAYAAPYYRIEGRCSHDMGRTWSEPFTFKTDLDVPIVGCHCMSFLRLPNGALGLFFSQGARGWKDDPLGFCVSTDEARTWSSTTTTVNPTKSRAYVAAGRGIIMQEKHKGRIVVSSCYREFGPMPCAEATLDNPPQHGHDIAENLTNSVAYFSDDQGITWNRARHEVVVVLDYGAGGFWQFAEPHAVELSTGDLLMFGQTSMGQLFASRSCDGGYSWQQPVATGLASSSSPCMVKRIPGTTDLLMIWNQVSAQEIAAGHQRHRLSCAVSQDDGETWRHFNNLESLDDTTYIEPPQPTRAIGGPRYKQPEDRKRYHRAPGVLRNHMARCAFVGDKAIISYDYGCVMDTIGSLNMKVSAVSSQPVSCFVS